jgi:hypothetical protein
MSKRLDRTWKVIDSHESSDASRCVDLFRRANGSFGFEEFRRDPEDRGEWTPVSYYSSREYSSEVEAIEAAQRLVPWFEGR